MYLGVREVTMKRLCLSLMFVILVSGAYAADFKILGGINLSKSTEPLTGVWTEIVGTPQFGAGFLFGGGLELPLSQAFTLEVDALYFQKGTGLELRNLDEEVVGHSMMRMSELSFPVLLKIYLRPGTSPFLLGGGEFAFKLASEPDPKNFGLVSQRTEYGFVLGAGLRKQIKGGYLSIEGRYNHGLQDMRSDFESLRKMRVFSLLMGFSF